MIPNTKIDHSRDALVARLIAATDADRAGDRYAAMLAHMASGKSIRAERLQPPREGEDRNDVLRRTRDRLSEHADAMMRLTGLDRVP